MVELKTESPPHNLTDVLLKMYTAETRWLAGFISTKKKTSTDGCPEILCDGSWEGESDFNRHLKMYRNLQDKLWERAAGDSAANQAAITIGILPHSDINLEGFHKELLGWLEARSERRAPRSEAELKAA